MSSLKLNEQVKVIATFEDEDEKSFVCNPEKMIYQGEEVTFEKFRINYSGLCRASERVFDLFDQEKKYRLVLNIDSLSWLLTSVGLRSA